MAINLDLCWGASAHPRIGHIVSETPRGVDAFAASTVGYSK
jgi:hypothetical protein